MTPRIKIVARYIDPFDETIYTFRDLVRAYADHEQLDYSEARERILGFLEELSYAVEDSDGVLHWRDVQDTLRYQLKLEEAWADSVFLDAFDSYALHIGLQYELP